MKRQQGLRANQGIQVGCNHKEAGSGTVLRGFTKKRTRKAGFKGMKRHVQSAAPHTKSVVFTRAKMSANGGSSKASEKRCLELVAFERARLECDPWPSEDECCKECSMARLYTDTGQRQTPTDRLAETCLSEMHVYWEVCPFDVVCNLKHSHPNRSGFTSQLTSLNRMENCAMKPKTATAIMTIKQRRVDSWQIKQLVFPPTFKVC